MAAGKVDCWGANGAGQLGNGSTTDRSVPSVVLDSGGVALADIIVVTAGDTHSCALDSGGTVQCWGGNGNGQLGDGTTNFARRASPVSSLGQDVVSVRAGYKHTCAVTGAGAIACWGDNSFGQLGDGTTVQRATPEVVANLGSGAAAVAPGYYHSCATTMTGGVKCWGYNYDGQLGDGTTTGRHTPVAVAGLAPALQTVAAGSKYSCALTTAGGVQCWGTNSAGELGDGTTTDRHAPVDVQGLSSGVEAITAGYGHTCALITASGIECWGSNDKGQLGNDSTTDSSVPVRILGGQSLAFAPPATIPTGASLTPTATATGGGTAPITFDTWTPDTCSVSGNSLTNTGAAGSLCGVRASRAGGSDGANDTTANAPQELRIIRITGATPTLTITGNPNPATYSQAVTYSATVSSERAHRRRHLLRRCHHHRRQLHQRHAAVHGRSQRQPAAMQPYRAGRGQLRHQRILCRRR